MYPCSIQTLQADALFASTLQLSDDLSIIHIRRAIAMTVDHTAPQDAPDRSPREFGDHPETAPMRMCWARATAAALDSKSAPTIRRMAAADSSVSGRKPMAGLSAIRSA